MVRILRRNRLARRPCGRSDVAFKWNYYEKLENAVLIRGSADLWVRLGVFRAAAGFQLAACQRRERAPGPRELSRSADLSHVPERGRHRGGFRVAAAGHRVPSAVQGLDP